MEKCIFCSSELKRSEKLENLWEFCECPVCGRYKYNECRLYTGEGIELVSEKASYLYYHNFSHEVSIKPLIIFGKKLDSEKIDQQHVYYPTNNEIIASFPVSFNEQIDLFLSGLFSRSKFLGASVSFSSNEIASALFLRRVDSNNRRLSEDELTAQIRYVLDYLGSNQFCSIEYLDDQIVLCLLPKGLERIDEYGRNPNNSRSIFIAMSFNSSTLSVREAIKKGVQDAGFEPVLIDEVIHNHQIVPEIFQFIRDSRLVIHEVSTPNNGAYYEAGYAEGQGKEVIVTCERASFNGEKGNNNRPHFDIQQKQLLLWDDLGDLSSRLTRWIRALTAR